MCHHILFTIIFYFSRYQCQTYRCPPCRAFTPILCQFYTKCCLGNKVQIVFVSLDRDDASFNEYFQKMPWASLPFDNESSTVKKNLSESLKVSGIPSLVVLDAKTGYFITDNAKLEISNLGKELINGGSALIASWKEMVAVDIKEGVFSNEAKGGIIA